MGGRVNTAVWVEASHRWRVDVQKDGAFTAPNRAGTASGKQTERRTPGWMKE